MHGCGWWYQEVLEGVSGWGIKKGEMQTDKTNDELEKQGHVVRQNQVETANGERE